jgi:hypothetical protein
VVSRCVDEALENIYETFDASLNPLHSSFAAFFLGRGFLGLGFQQSGYVALIQLSQRKVALTKIVEVEGGCGI